MKPDELVTGNYFDKYGSSNPIVRRLMDGFFGSFDELLQQIPIVHGAFEIGCGEGYLAAKVAQKGILVSGCDISPECVDHAQEFTKSMQAAGEFFVRNLYDLTPDDVKDANLVICCEVLEHVDDPERALEVLSRLASPFLLASVPREPLWRCLNILRGKYIADLGNTPGHLQNWNTKEFIRFLSRKFEILQVNNPTPWTMVLARARVDSE